MFYRTDNTINKDTKDSSAIEVVIASRTIDIQPGHNLFYS